LTGKIAKKSSTEESLTPITPFNILKKEFKKIMTKGKSHYISSFFSSASHNDTPASITVFDPILYNYSKGNVLAKGHAMSQELMSPMSIGYNFRYLKVHLSCQGGNYQVC
jgi:hypothetical protein